ncbi:MAG: hypothetical protein J6L01_00735 [Alistipes sp.]|nr:hypothetical protein [Alistipes sp.]
MKKWTFWKVTMILTAVVSLGASVYESNTSETVPMLKEVAQSCYILAIVSFCFAYIFPAFKSKDEATKEVE